MADVVSKEVRSRMMAGIRGKNTAPEMAVRRALHAKGFRYRLHSKKLPGKPDIVLVRHRVAIFVHGCFWHGHNCHLFKWPKTEAEFWRQKIEKNVSRHQSVRSELIGNRWRVLEVWECSIKGRHRSPIESVAQEIYDWMYSDETSGVVEGLGNAGH